jgi:chromatin remodeling complex protein RSC6
MGRPAGSLESRSNVTKHITNYVREKGLKNKHDIVPDNSLRSLLNLKEGEQLTYFNLQKHLNVHYPKSAKAVAAAAAAQ